MSKLLLRGVVAATFALAATGAAKVADGADPMFRYEPPGTLVRGSGTGRVDANVYVPGMRFPLESGPAFANSQVWGRGGGSGPGGSQCDKENFSYPWYDNYCESRSWEMPLCPSGSGHQGQDIRAASCEKGVHWAVAVADGTITQVGSYSVYITAPDGTRFDYLHMSDVQVTEGQKVKQGDRVGKISNVFGGTATTVHLHFNIRQNVAGVGSVYVPGYLSLVKSYERLLGINQPANVADAAPPSKSTPTLVEVPVSASNPMERESAAAESEPEDSSGCTSHGHSQGEAFGGLACLAALALVVARRRKP